MNSDHLVSHHPHLDRAATPGGRVITVDDVTRAATDASWEALNLVLDEARWTAPLFVPGGWPLSMPDVKGVYNYFDPSTIWHYPNGSSRLTYIGRGWLRDRAGLTPHHDMQAAGDGDHHVYGRFQWHARAGLVIGYSQPAGRRAWDEKEVEAACIMIFDRIYLDSPRFNRNYPSCPIDVEPLVERYRTQKAVSDSGMTAFTG